MTIIQYSLTGSVMSTETIVTNIKIILTNNYI